MLERPIPVSYFPNFFPVVSYQAACIDLRASLFNYAKKYNIHPSRIDGLQFGYCTNENTLLCVENWFQKIFPTQYMFAIPESIAWVNDIRLQVHFIRSCPNISQINLNKKLILFYEKYIAGLVSDEEKQRVTKALQGGLCSGYAKLTAYAMIESSLTHTKTTYRHDSLWVYNKFTTLVAWDGVQDFSQQFVKDCTELLEILLTLQGGMFDIAFAWQSECEKLMDDTSQKVPLLRCKVAADFQQSEVKSTYDQLLWEEKQTSSRKSFQGSRQFILNQVELGKNISGHDTCIIQVGLNKYFYDSNNLTGPILVNDNDALAFLLFLSSATPGNPALSIAFNVYGYSYNETFPYPATETILTRLRFTEPSEVAMSLAIHIKCADSIKWILQKKPSLQYNFIIFDAAIITTLLRINPDYDAYLDKNFIIVRAITLNFTDLVDLLVRQYPKRVAPHKQSLVDYSILYQRVEILRILLELKPNLTVKNLDGLTIKEHALKNAQQLYYPRLHEVKDAEGWTPLMRAVRDKDNDKVELLLLTGADPLLKAPNKLLPIQFAPTEMQPQLANAMIASIIHKKTLMSILRVRKYKPPVDKVFAGNDRLILLAAREGTFDQMRDLLALKPDLSVANTDGKTALHLAAARGHYLMVRLLLNAGANSALTTRDGKLPGDLAKDQRIVVLLAQHNANKMIVKKNLFSSQVVKLKSSNTYLGQSNRRASI